MDNIFVSKIKPPDNLNTPSYWMIFDDFRLLVHNQDGQVRVPRLRDPSAIGVDVMRKQYLGFIDNPAKQHHFFCAEAKNAKDVPDGMEFLSLRRLFARLEDTMLSLAGRAVQIVEWNRTHQFCGRCGSTVQTLPYERAKKCPKCGLTSYPRLAPAIIVKIERDGPDGKEILLAHNKRHPAGFYSVLAGFVEPGETLEECVRREIREEVSIEVKNISYFGSQPWPFPHSLMIAFTAEYANGDIILEEDELDDAKWFPPADLPQVPPPISIARQLIDSFIQAQGSHR